MRKIKAPPPGFETIEPILEALDNELRDKVKESSLGKRKTESQWPIHQINWQRSRYVYDMFYTYNRISRKVYDYCIKNKIVDALLIAKWKKPGYENLCSTYVINPANYKFGTTSICRVPKRDRNGINIFAQDPTTGCLGCASGNNSINNIFGNKYGQNLAAVQIAREKRSETINSRKFEECEFHLDDKNRNITLKDGDNTDDETTDDDCGVSLPSVIWAGNMKLEHINDNLDNCDSTENNDNLIKKRRFIND